MFNNISLVIKKINSNIILTFSLGSILGLFIFYLIYGFEIVRFTNVNWLYHSDDLEGIWDLTQHHMGWVFFRNSDWTFPIGLTSGIASESISVTYTDSIPLFAIFFKILSPFLPTNFQYIGLFELITYMFIGGFGAIIAFKYNKNIYSNLLISCFFIISPILTKRAFYHTALSAHWLILAAFCLCIYRSALNSKTSIVLWSLLCGLSVTINPYYTPMIIGIMLCDCLYLILSKHLLFQCFIKLLSCSFITLLICFINGFFVGSVSSSSAGLELLSANLNTLINPMDKHLHIPEPLCFIFTDNNYSSIFTGLPYGIDWQEEGFAYLGLGFIILSIGCFILIVYNCCGKKIKPSNINLKILLPVLIGFIVFSALAIGPVCYINSICIYKINWPTTIYNLLSIFRSEGRFIWPVHYGLMALVVILLSIIIKSKYKYSILLSVCLLIQLFDLYPSLTFKHSIYNHIEYSTETDFDDYYFSTDIWDYIGQNVDEIIFDAPTDTNICINPALSCNFEIFASKYNINLSASYCSRPIYISADKYLNQCLNARACGHTNKKQLFILHEKSNTSIYKSLGFNLYSIDGLTIATELNLSSFFNTPS